MPNLYIYCVLPLILANYANAISVDSDAIMEEICKKSETYIGRKHLSRCLFTYTPKKLLIIWEMCKKEIVGKVKFDNLLVTFCDEDQEDKRSEWIECTEKYQKKGPASKLKDGKYHDEFIYLAMKCMVMEVKEFD